MADCNTALDQVAAARDLALFLMFHFSFIALVAIDVGLYLFSRISSVQ
jgi:hypothetical protein